MTRRQPIVGSTASRDPAAWMLPVLCTSAFLVFVQAFMVAPLIPRLADVFHTRVGWVGLAVPAIPAGVALTAVCALILAAPMSLLVVQAAIVALSLGFDLTQPLLAGIVTDLRGGRAQATGLMAFALFSGFGLGSLLFQIALQWGFTAALVLFGVTAMIAAAVAVPLFRDERPHATSAASPASPTIPAV